MVREYTIHLSVRLGYDRLYGRACDTHYGWYGHESAQRKFDPGEVTCGRCKRTSTYKKKLLRKEQG